MTTPPRDAFDPDCVPPHSVDEEGNFTGWLSDAEIEEQLAITAEAYADQEPPSDGGTFTLAELLARQDATDEECPF